MTSQKGNTFILMKGELVTQNNKKVTWFSAVNAVVATVGQVGKTVKIEAVIKSCDEYRGVWSTMLQDVEFLTPGGQTSSYVSSPGKIITERVKILSSKPAMYGGKEIRMETPSGQKLIAYDSHSQLQLANAGELWDITAKVKKHARGLTQIYYISSATKV